MKMTPNEYVESKLDMLTITVRNFCISHGINSDADRDDMYQTVYENALTILYDKAEVRLMDEEGLDSYMCRSAINIMKDMIKGKCVRQKHVTTMDENSTVFMVEDQSEKDTSESLSDYITIKKELMMQALEAADERIKEVTRTRMSRAFDYAILSACGHSYASIAEQSNTTEQAVKVAICRMRKYIEEKPALSVAIREALG